MLNEENLLSLKEKGFCVIPDMLSAQALERCREAFDSAVKRQREAGHSTHDERLDPNAFNIRLYNLPEQDPCFIDLLLAPAALKMVEAVLGPHFIISNFTANNALPGSGPMRIHADQALSVPPPWNEPWAVNLIWCLDDTDEKNGATHYLPNSHRIRSFEEVPDDMASGMRPFEASAGSVIVMEGRVWHASGSNTSADRQRRFCFAYYCSDFVRPQMNWEAVLSPATKAALDEKGSKLFGLGPAGNTRLGGQYSRLDLA